MEVNPNDIPPVVNPASLYAEGWRAVFYGAVTALLASAIHWRTVLYDTNSRFRWGAALIQIPTAAAIGIVSQGMITILQHWYTELNFWSVGALAGIVSFWGPLSFMKILDAAATRISGRPIEGGATVNAKPVETDKSKEYD